MPGRERPDGGARPTTFTLMDAVSPFGQWPSPLSAERVAQGKASLSEICSDDRSVFWLESRPAEGGRVVFVRANEEGVTDLSPETVSIRSRVHEYGGGACCLVPGHGPDAFAYVDLIEQRVWLHPGGEGPPIALTDAAPAGERWAHGGLGASSDGAWVVAVREVHRADADSHVDNSDHARSHDAERPRRSIVALGTRPENFGESTLADGHDFYGAPRLDAATRRMVTVVWDHPDMQWDRSTVMVTPLAVTVDAKTGMARLVAEGAPWSVPAGDDVSMGQPQWRSDGGLLFISDRHGWWQPHAHSGAADGSEAVALTTAAAEFHGPDWALGQATLTELADGTVVARQTSDGLDSVVLLHPPDQNAAATTSSPRLVPQPCVAISALCRHGEGIAFIGAPPDGPPNVWTLSLADSATATATATPDPPRALRPRPDALLDRHDISAGEPFSLTGRSGRPVYGLVYRPTLPGTIGPPDDHPPLVVICHGGPTSSVGAGFDSVVQYFTSRGFAVAAVDYAGSTGYGRTFRCSLWGLWGVADAEDCVDAARHLAQQGVVDPARMAIRGSSSGGLTALNALAAGDCFAAAVTWYGVTDLLGLAASTHDFEAHYMDRLIGPLPESREIYEARSPTRRAAEIHGSVLLLQGLDDLVVPPAQTAGLHEALLAHGRRAEVRYFEGESHGFRRADTLVAALEEELAFYRRELRL